jgi:hypothetical protein
MPRCIVCNSEFCHLSFGGPSEPCDCGQEYTRADWRADEPQGETLAERRRRYTDDLTEAMHENYPTSP